MFSLFKRTLCCGIVKGQWDLKELKLNGGNNLAAHCLMIIVCLFVILLKINKEIKKRKNIGSNMDKPNEPRK